MYERPKKSCMGTLCFDLDEHQSSCVITSRSLSFELYNSLTLAVLSHEWASLSESLTGLYVFLEIQYTVPAF